MSVQRVGLLLWLGSVVAYTQLASCSAEHGPSMGPQLPPSHGPQPTPAPAPTPPTQPCTPPGAQTQVSQAPLPAMPTPCLGCNVQHGGSSSSVQPPVAMIQGMQAAVPCPQAAPGLPQPQQAEVNIAIWQQLTWLTTQVNWLASAVDQILHPQSTDASTQTADPADVHGTAAEAAAAAAPAAASSQQQGPPACSPSAGPQLPAQDQERYPRALPSLEKLHARAEKVAASVTRRGARGRPEWMCRLCHQSNWMMSERCRGCGYIQPQCRPLYPGACLPPWPAWDTWSNTVDALRAWKLGMQPPAAAAPAGSTGRERSRSRHRDAAVAAPSPSTPAPAADSDRRQRKPMSPKRPPAPAPAKPSQAPNVQPTAPETPAKAAPASLRRPPLKNPPSMQGKAAAFAKPIRPNRPLISDAAQAKANADSSCSAPAAAQSTSRSSTAASKRPRFHFYLEVSDDDEDNAEADQEEDDAEDANAPHSRRKK